jgi:hypothetical protein
MRHPKWKDEIGSYMFINERILQLRVRAIRKCMSIFGVYDLEEREHILYGLTGIK